MHAISECFKKPFPAVEDNDKRYDLTHVLDLCSQLNHVTVVGCAERYLQSNIIPNNLNLEFSSFKVFFYIYLIPSIKFHVLGTEVAGD